MSEEPEQPPTILPDYSQPPKPNQYASTGHPPAEGAMDRIIPTKNPTALIAYYLGVFSIVPCFSPLLGPAAVVLGILGLKACSRTPGLPGKGHAIAGIVLGSIMFVLVTATVILVLTEGKRS